MPNHPHNQQSILMWYKRNRSQKRRSRNLDPFSLSVSHILFSATRTANPRPSLLCRSSIRPPQSTVRQRPPTGMLFRAARSLRPAAARWSSSRRCRCAPETSSSTPRPSPTDPTLTASQNNSRINSIRSQFQNLHLQSLMGRPRAWPSMHLVSASGILVPFKLRLESECSFPTHNWVP